MDYSQIPASKSSPRTWGCFLRRTDSGRRVLVFPTHVGVFLISEARALLRKSLPHARGGVSRRVQASGLCRLSSPRTWGCFSIQDMALDKSPVFPTHVGVFLLLIRSTEGRLRLPHARGGVSDRAAFSHAVTRSSPRTWGCFRPGAGRSLKEESLPHARGGVSRQDAREWRGCASSPRTWGCFFLPGHILRSRGVFPTHVGVFPSSRTYGRGRCGLPHARGGVSSAPQDFGSPRSSSPRTWGCFRLFRHSSNTFSVFPTHVGVFPPITSERTGGFCLPHARGGVSEG